MNDSIFCTSRTSTPKTLRRMRRAIRNNRRSTSLLCAAIGLLTAVVALQEARIARLENKDETAG